jgi:hypothetical protein
MSYESLTVKELKEQLKELGLPLSGRKAELIERLVEVDTKKDAEGDADGQGDDGAVGEDDAAPVEAPAAPTGAQKPGSEPKQDEHVDFMSENLAEAAPAAAMAVDTLKHDDQPSEHTDYPKQNAVTAKPDELKKDPADAKEKNKATLEPGAAKTHAGGAKPTISSDDCLSMGTDDEEPDQSKIQQGTKRASAQEPPASRSRKAPTPIIFPGSALSDPSSTEAPASSLQPLAAGTTPSKPATHHSLAAPPSSRGGLRGSTELAHSESTDTQSASAKRKRATIVFDPTVADAAEGAVAAVGNKAGKVDRKAIVVSKPEGSTRALRIDGFRRPLREADLKAMLGETGCALLLPADSAWCSHSSGLSGLQFGVPCCLSVRLHAGFSHLWPLRNIRNNMWTVHNDCHLRNQSPNPGKCWRLVPDFSSTR